MLLHVLLILYPVLMLMDLLFMLTLHFVHDNKGYYKTAAAIWFGMLIGFFMDGMIAEKVGPVNHIFGISFLSITTFYLGKLSADIYRFNFPAKFFVKFTLLTWSVGTALHYLLNASFAVSAFVICMGVVAPALFAGYRILRGQQAINILDRLFAAIIIGEGLHILDYPFLRQMEGMAVYGFSLGLCLVYFASMLIPVVINRRLSSDFNDILQNQVDAKTKSLEDSLKQLNDAQTKLAYSAKFAALGEMAGGVAHEINTPLGVLKLRSSQIHRLLERKEFDVDAVKTMAKAIEDTTDRIAKIVQGLKFFSRNSAGDPLKSHLLSEIVQNTLSLCSEKISSRGIAVEVAPIPNIEISCRPGQISQVLVNLLSNAADAVEQLSEKWIRILFKDSPTHIQISVVDSGGGIHPEIQSKLFQPFFTTKSVGHGTGLGLSISKGIIEDHKGTLNLDFANRNTCFVIQMPKISSRSVSAA